MSDLDRRWRRLVDAARKTPPTEPPPLSAASVEQLARRGLAARATTAVRGETRPSERWAWAALVALATAGALAFLWTHPTLRQQTALLTRGLAELPGRLPAAPEIPAPFRLPPAPEALALLPDSPGLRVVLGLPPSPEATP
jgi:hypothetical protein